MSSELTFDILNNFSSEKIIKLFQRFKITITDSELQNLIENSFSIKQLSDALLSNNRPSQIVKDNIDRYLAYYWELHYPSKIYLEKITYEINSRFLDTDKSTPTDKLFSDHIELFGKISAITTNIKTSEELLNYPKFYSSLKNWIVKFLALIVDLQEYPENIMDIVSDLRNFMENFFDPNDQSEINFSFDLTNCLLNAPNTTQSETTDCLTNLKERSFSPLGIYLVQLKFSLKNTNFGLDRDIIRNLHTWLKEKSVFGNSSQIESLISKLEELKAFPDKRQSKYLQSTIETVKKIQLDIENQKNSTYTHLDVNLSDFQSNCRLFPIVEFSSPFIEQKMLELYVSKGKSNSLNQIFENIIKKDLTIKLNINCPNCGILYPIDVKQVLFPPNWKEMVKSKNNEPDNGKIFFKEEITCPVCQSFKFVISHYSKLYIINFLSYLNEKFLERKYNIKNVENPMVLVTIDSKLIKKVKNIDDAVSKIDSLIKKHKNDPSYYKEKAVFMVSLNDYNEAKKLFNTVLSMEPTDIQSLCYLIKIAHGRNQKDQSKKLIVELMQIVTDDSSLFIPNFKFLREINDIVLDLKDSKLAKDYKKFLQD